jgi:hypothetical protein
MMALPPYEFVGGTMAVLSCRAAKPVGGFAHYGLQKWKRALHNLNCER